MKKAMLAFAILIFSGSVYASHSQQAKITGLVSAINAKTVKLYVHGHYVTVPKSSFAKGTKLAMGQEVTAFVKSPEIVKKKAK